MLAYDEIDTFTFIWLFDGRAVAAKDARTDVGSILRSAGVERKDGEPLLLDLSCVAGGARFHNPTLASLAGGEVYIECKEVLDLGESFIELQLGCGRFINRGLLSIDGYTAEIRDRLIEAVGAVAALDGFLAGFSIHLGNDENEVEYRQWFTECIVGGRFSLERLINHDWLSIHSLAVGPSYVRQHGHDLFLKCPAWRVLEPRADVICVFLDNLVEGLNRARLESVSRVREALAHLRRHLKDDASAGNEPQGK